MSEIMTYRNEDLTKIKGDNGEEIGYSCPDCGGLLIFQEETPVGEELYLCFSCFTTIEVVS